MIGGGTRARIGDPPRLAKRLSLRLGDMVVTMRGRVGMVAYVHDPGSVWILVKFGAGGPIGRFKTARLRRAHSVEVDRAGLEGVGRNPTFDEEQGLVDQREFEEGVRG